MFGTYRLLLACLVALSHFGLNIIGYNPGQTAVLSFYVLSGFLMEHLYHKLGTVRGFYTDRFLRIYPLFAVILLFAALLSPPSFAVGVLNALLLPLNYSAFTHVPVLVGPSWSLACEAHFYLLVPFLACQSTRVLRWITISSVSLFAVTPFLPFSTFLAFEGLPGILFAFLSGMLIKRRDLAFLQRVWLLFLLLLALFIYSKFCHSGLPTGIHINVRAGYLTALPLVIWLSAYSAQVKWDQRLGLLSYPLFLVHLPLRNFMGLFFPHVPMLLLLALALAAAALLVVTVEKPFDKIRYRFRQQRPPTGKSPGGSGL